MSLVKFAQADLDQDTDRHSLMDIRLVTALVVTLVGLAVAGLTLFGSAQGRVLLVEQLTLSCH
jgi:hypothetical protein